MADLLTDNFGLTKITPGTTGWAAKMNENLDRLGRLFVIDNGGNFWFVNNAIYDPDTDSWSQPDITKKSNAICQSIDGIVSFMECVSGNSTITWSASNLNTRNVSKLEANIMLNAFNIAISNNLTLYNMVDGVVDVFEDTEGVDLVNSVNGLYDSDLKSFGLQAAVTGMTLISQTFEAEGIPTTIKIICLESDCFVGITLNIDIKAYVSRDAGTTWVQVSLANLGWNPSDVSAQPFYPPVFNSTYVRATTTYTVGSDYSPHLSTNPSMSLIGNYAGNQWLSTSPVNQRFHIDLGESKNVTRIYYENSHGFGDYCNMGAKDFTFWGSNESSDFADLVYANNGTWNQLLTYSDVECNTAKTSLDEHIALDQPDPKYLYLESHTPYRYYAMKFANNYGSAGYVAIRHIELQEAYRANRVLEGEADVATQTSGNNVRWKLETYNSKKLEIKAVGVLWR